VEAKARGKTSDLIKHLITDGTESNLIQVMRLLYLHSGPDGEESLLDYTTVRSDLGLAPPRSEIHNVETRIEHGNLISLIITVSMFQMYGTGSPLPLFYTQELLREYNRGESTSRDFIDCVSSLIYDSYFKTWQKCDVLHSLFEKNDEDFWERLFCITGLGIKAGKDAFFSPQSYIAFSSFTSRMVKTAEGLRVILSMYTKDHPLRIEQCHTRKAQVPLDQRCVIGRSGNVLGESIFLGSTLIDRMNAIRILIGPIKSSELMEYVPDGSMIPLFQQIFKLYVDRLIVWDCKINIHAHSVRTTQPGNRTFARLGWNTWVFSGTLKEDIVSTVVKGS
jgi:type VI secretion system protein ImpH